MKKIFYLDEKGDKSTLWIKCDSEEKWLDLRCLGGSDISLISYTNNYELDKDGNLKDEKEYVRCLTEFKYKLLGRNDYPRKEFKEANKRSMAYGHIHENEVVEEIKKLDDFKNYDFRHTDGFETFIDVKRPYRSASIDGRIIDKKTNDTYIVEIKTTKQGISKNFATKRYWDINNFPTTYLTQGLHYLSVLKDNPNIKGVVYGIEFRDASLDKEIEDKTYGNTYSNDGEKFYKIFILKKDDKVVQELLSQLEKIEDNLYNLTFESLSKEEQKKVKENFDKILNDSSKIPSFKYTHKNKKEYNTL